MHRKNGKSSYSELSQHASNLTNRKTHYIRTYICFIEFEKRNISFQFESLNKLEISDIAAYEEGLVKNADAGLLSRIHKEKALSDELMGAVDSYVKDYTETFVNSLQS